MPFDSGVRCIHVLIQDEQIGALLRREGLYSSQLSKWREQYRTEALQALRDGKRGRKAAKNPLEDEVTRLRREGNSQKRPFNK